MKYFVYLLISTNSNRAITYVGYTYDIKNRLRLHNTSKGAKFTKGRKWKVVYKKTYHTKSEAMKNEYILKKNKKKRLFLKNKYLNKS